VNTMPVMDFDSRLVRLRIAADLKRDDAMYISSLPNIRYLSGFSGSAGLLLVTAQAAVLITDRRYEAASKELCQGTGVQVVAASSDHQFDTVKGLLKGSKRLLLDPSQVSMETYWRIKESVPTADIVHVQQLIERLRLTKDAGEIARIHTACDIALQAFDRVPGWLEDQLTERLIANRLEASMKEMGAEDIAFATIVASGPNSAKPHHQPGDRVPREGEPIIIDFGAVVDGYCSDITRTIWVGELQKEHTALYEAAVAAHAAGVRAVGVGVSHSEVDAACRQTFKLYGFEDMPLHPSGHNLGLSIHERPFLTPYASEPIGDGYVLTVEPGLYRPSKAGFRIEDTLLVQADHVKVLSSSRSW
jgi:Xaa-Pro aminopeptidase